MADQEEPQAELAYDDWFYENNRKHRLKQIAADIDYSERLLESGQVLYSRAAQRAVSMVGRDQYAAVLAEPRNRVFREQRPALFPEQELKEDVYARHPRPALPRVSLGALDFSTRAESVPDLPPTVSSGSRGGAPSSEYASLDPDEYTMVSDESALGMADVWSRPAHARDLSPERLSREERALGRRIRYR
jgi:hypothetical protein